MPDDNLAELETRLSSTPDLGDEDRTVVTAPRVPTASATAATSAATPPPLVPGTVLFETYEIVEALGAGGMGDVFRAKHLQLPGYRAVKVMNPTLVSDKEAVTHFHREARTLLKVAHPAIVRCHDLLRDEFGRFFLIMELIEGISLSERMNSKWLTPKEVRILGARLASGLAEVHSHGVVHRDIAPDNIMLPEGKIELAKLIDFGIAKWLQPGEESVFGWKGKLRYASPEQFGFFDGVIDYRSDYYSLALMLCAAAHVDLGEMGSNFQTAIESRQSLPERHSQIPSALRKDLVPLLAFDPKNRPESIESSFRDATPNVASGKGSERTHSAIRRIATALAILLGAGVAALGALYVLRTPEVVEAPPVAVAPSVEVAALPPVAAPLPDPFWSLRREFERASGRPEGSAFLDVSPNPVVDGDAYRLRITPDCDCYAMVFLLDAEESRVDLVYPNEFDAPRRLTANEVFEVPSNDIYRLEAVSGAGVDRLKLVLLNEPSSLAPEGTSWSYEEGETQREGEFASFLQTIADAPANEWSTADALLRIQR